MIEKFEVMIKFQRKLMTEGYYKTPTTILKK